MNQDEMFVKRSIELSRISVEKGEKPFGCVIVIGDSVIAESENKTVAGNDFTQHAELLAIRIAQKKLGKLELSECTIYSSTEPCPMCAFMIREAKIPRVVFSVVSPVMGGYTRFHVLQDTGLESFDSFAKVPEIIGGVLENEGNKVWDTWRKKTYG